MRTNVSRRDFVSLAGRGLLWLCGLFGLGMVGEFLNFQSQSQQPTQYKLGNASQYPVGSRTIVQGAQAVMLRSPKGFMAFSLVCPHLGCTVHPVEDGFSCPCHGSLFGSQGELRRGPADRALRALRIELTPENELILHTD